MSTKMNMNRKPVTSSVVYIGQIPYDWDENVIKSVVCGSGKVVEVRLGFDYAGKNKGFCFVEYQTKADAAYAIGLLNQIQLANGNQIKKLRIESSKEGFLKSSAPSEQKPVLHLFRDHLPSYVILPPEMAGGSPMGPMTNMQNNMQLPNMPPMPPMGGMPPMMGGMPMNNMNNMGASPVMGGPTGPIASASPLTSLKFPPAPPQIPLAIPDKINETLSKIPPAQLIEFISTVRNVLSGPESARAIELFQFSPHLAATAAQALILMGFIDNEVISDAMKTAASSHSAPAQHQQYQPQQGLGAGSVQYGQSTSKWPHLPPHTQAKLAAVAPDQAELIAQVLSLPSDQISSLPIDKQRMVTDLRSQYL